MTVAVIGGTGTIGPWSSPPSPPRARSGQPFVILRPNAFMQTLIGKILLPSVLATGTVPNPIADAGISFVDARDVGASAAALTSSAWDGETLVLTGPRP